jgi:hypothetical protein
MSYEHKVNITRRRQFWSQILHPSLIAMSDQGQLSNTSSGATSAAQSLRLRASLTRAPRLVKGLNSMPASAGAEVGSALWTSAALHHGSLRKRLPPCRPSRLPERSRRGTHAELQTVVRANLQRHAHLHHLTAQVSPTIKLSKVVRHPRLCHVVICVLAKRLSETRMFQLSRF